MWRVSATTCCGRVLSPLAVTAIRWNSSSSPPPRRRKGFFQLGDMYTPGRYTSKNLPKGPSASNQPWDPVYAQHAFRLITGPLKRKQYTTPDDHLTVDEVEKWMDAMGAAKVLGIKEQDLQTLTPAVLEQHWVKAYGERNNASQQETVIAAEVLLEYIDSTLYRKKSRQYYRNYMDNARQAIDNETETRRSEHRQKFIYILAVFMFVGSLIVMIIAVCRDVITKDDLKTIGANAATYLNMVLSQPPNPEPAPDYSTRYRDTPTFMDLDKQKGVYGVPNPARLSELAEEVRQYRNDEEAEMIRILNDENESSEEARREQLARGSRVTVYREEDFDEAGRLKESSTNGEKVDPITAYSNMSFREFANLMASQFGGGSRFQRITQDSVRRAGEIDEMHRRMKEVKG
uniref:Transmembrane protein n=1 Tax=Trypanosoma congolense (strain IL3000) TaxID=1068625 RepID=G0URV8_TRYCI|nr:conserved hypothetical protein [Trypanosoma congolense IL3000]